MSRDTPAVLDPVTLDEFINMCTHAYTAQLWLSQHLLSVAISCPVPEAPSELSARNAVLSFANANIAGLGKLLNATKAVQNQQLASRIYGGLQISAPLPVQPPPTRACPNIPLQLSRRTHVQSSTARGHALHHAAGLDLPCCTSSELQHESRPPRGTPHQFH